MIEPDWTLLFSRKRGPWWVRLLACGRYNHVKALAYVPAVRAWMLYDVKFNGTRLMLVREDDAECGAALASYLAHCDMIAMPRLPVPSRKSPHAGFWCTLAMKHLVGIEAGALRPDRLWRDCLAAGGTAFLNPEHAEPGSVAHTLHREEPARGIEAMLGFAIAHAEQPDNGISWANETAFTRKRSAPFPAVRRRIGRIFGIPGAAAEKGRAPYSSASAGA